MAVINAHGTGTRANDTAEAACYGTVFGRTGPEPRDASRVGPSHPSSSKKVTMTFSAAPGVSANSKARVTSANGTW
ncbi:hypothetical protein [Streptomyces sp. NPDC052127]|uniref:hypothetical protein n=1 Tax=Streptomyces sp. NPDC052127 TaxID=3155679 RepID=UPI003421C92E